MAADAHGRARRAWLSIGGFACSLGFVFAACFLDFFGASTQAVWGIERASLISVLLFMIAAFSGVSVFSPKHRSALFSSHTLGLLACVTAVGALLLSLQDDPLGRLVFGGVCVGLPAGVLLCAWGRLLGAEPIERSVPEVFISAALGAAVCFVFDVVPLPGIDALLSLLPLGSVAFYHALCKGSEAGAMGAAAGTAGAAGATGAAGSADAGGAGKMPGEGVSAGVVGAPSEEAASLGGRIIAGTAIYGFAAGLLEAFRFGGDAYHLGAPSLMLLLFVLYCLAALQLFGNRPLAGVRRVLPTRDNDARAKEGGPLDGAYRLSVLLMTSGLLLTLALGRLNDLGEAVVLAGFLGVMAVLASLFLVMGRLGTHDSSQAFARGFGALFAGEVVGVVAGRVLEGLGLGDMAPLAMALAGVAVLCGFLFLFTERDMRALSIVVEDTDVFGAACARIAGEALLSKREAEILPLALRGRTSERMAGELFISKNTVDTHLRRIYAKCGVHSRQELIDLGERTERALRDARK